MKRIAIIGSTGSIGCNTLRVIENHPKEFAVTALAARQNVDLLFKQAKRFQPKLVCVFESSKAHELARRLRPYRIRVVTGEDGLLEVAKAPSVQQVVFAVVGAVGLRPLVGSINAGKSVAIANKESLVMAGELIVRFAREKKVELLPIDSEHSGLWQCLEGRDPSEVQNLFLTSSGGPFFGRRINFKRVTVREALRHPRWRMGPKITIDSATLMNKGLEVIEAANLFSISPDRIKVLIHPEAIVHALVEFVDGSQLAQLGVTDMRLPIQYALSYPGRINNSLPSLQLGQIREFHFFEPDTAKFPCLALGYEAKRKGGTMPAVLNAANEVAVRRFLNGLLSFDLIPKVIERVMKKHKTLVAPLLADILEADRWARAEAEEVCLGS